MRYFKAVNETSDSDTKQCQIITQVFNAFGLNLYERLLQLGPVRDHIAQWLEVFWASSKGIDNCTGPSRQGKLHRPNASTCIGMPLCIYNDHSAQKQCQAALRPEKGLVPLPYHGAGSLLKHRKKTGLCNSQGKLWAAPERGLGFMASLGSHTVNASEGPELLHWTFSCN